MRKGFTLIELLIVIAIIGILAGVVLATGMRGAAQSRDSRRVKEVYQIGRTIQQYYVAFGEYPDGTPDNLTECGESWDVGNHYTGDHKLLPTMSDTGFTNLFPLEFKEEMPCNYRYLKGACGCNNGAILYAKCESGHCPEEERPDYCCDSTACPDVCASQGSDEDQHDIFIYFE